MALVFLANIAIFAEDDDLARQRAQEAVQLGRSTHIGQVVGEGLRVLAILDSRAGDFEGADRRLAEMIAISEAAGDRFQLLAARNTAAELIASRGDVARTASHLAAGAELAREMPSSEPALEFILSAACVAYMDGRADDAAVLLGARLARDHPPFPTLGRPILEAIKNQGLREPIAAGKNLSADEALERAIYAISPRPAAPA